MNANEFREQFKIALASCDYNLDNPYSVFTQYDADYYLTQRTAFEYKYKCLWAIAKVLQPKKIIELGCFAGAAAHAYLHASPESVYVGYDRFPICKFPDGRLFPSISRFLGATCLKRARPIIGDLRKLASIHPPSELVVIDAAHDFANVAADLALALTARPSYILADDYVDDVRKVMDAFLSDTRVEWSIDFNYTGGGILVALKPRGMYEDRRRHHDVESHNDESPVSAGTGL